MAKSHTWEYVLNLNHDTQVEEFGWCACEEQEYYPYSNCPKENKGETK